jgi:hypothetical protein
VISVKKCSSCIWSWFLLRLVAFCSLKFCLFLRFPQLDFEFLLSAAQVLNYVRICELVVTLFKRLSTFPDAENGGCFWRSVGFIVCLPGGFHKCPILLPNIFAALFQSLGFSRKSLKQSTRWSGCELFVIYRSQVKHKYHLPIACSFKRKLV